MEMRTREEIRLWESSQVYAERKKIYQEERKALCEYIKKYIGKQKELEEKCQPFIKTYQYAIGNSILHRGALCPSKMQDVVIGNVKRGRLVKKIGKQQPSFMYSCDEAGKLLKAESIEKFPETEYLLYEDNCEIGISYRASGELFAVSRVIREEGRLLSYQFGYSIMEEKCSMWSLFSEKYFYEADHNLVKVDMVNLNGDAMNYDRIDVKIDEFGRGLSYKWYEIIGEKIFGEDNDEREITKKLFFYGEEKQEKEKKKGAKEKMKETDIVGFLSERVKRIMETWQEEGIYAISFFVQENDEGEVPEFVISYNTEEDCDGAEADSEERWNYACWRQDEEIVIEEKDEKIIREWYAKQGILEEELGCERSEKNYDESGEYIGKGPKGHYELVQVLVEVAKKLKEEKVIEHCCKKKVPIIIHDLEYSWYLLEATKKANTDVDMTGFFKAIEECI